MDSNAAAAGEQPTSKKAAKRAARRAEKLARRAVHQQIAGGGVAPPQKSESSGSVLCAFVIVRAFHFYQNLPLALYVLHTFGNVLHVTSVASAER